MMSLRILRLPAFAAVFFAGSLIGSACSWGDDGTDSLSVGSGASPEEALVGQITVQVLEMAGFEVTDHTGLSTFDSEGALLDGDEQIIVADPIERLNLDYGKSAQTPSEAIGLLRQEEEDLGVEWLDPPEFCSDPTASTSCVTLATTDQVLEDAPAAQVFLDAVADELDAERVNNLLAASDLPFETTASIASRFVDWMCRNVVKWQ